MNKNAPAFNIGFNTPQKSDHHSSGSGGSYQDEYVYSGRKQWVPNSNSKSVSSLNQSQNSRNNRNEPFYPDYNL